MKTVEIVEFYQQYSTIRIMILKTIKKTNLDSITVNRDPSSDIDLANKKYVHDSIGDGNVLKFNQTLENYLKTAAGNDVYDLTKYDKIQITETTKNKYPNTSGYLLQNWVIKCNDTNNNSKKQNFEKSTKTNSPTSPSEATRLSPIGDSFTYIESSPSIHGNNVFVSFERTNFIQITNLTFYYTRFLVLTKGLLKSKGRFRVHLLLEDDTWITK